MQLACGGRASWRSVPELPADRNAPADSDRDGLKNFAVAEAAKRRLIFQLLDLSLPIGSDLSFDLLSSERKTVMTGHADGVITLDLAESGGRPSRATPRTARRALSHACWAISAMRSATTTGRSMVRSWRSIGALSRALWR